MSNYAVTGDQLTAIADAIRLKTDSAAEMSVDDMPLQIGLIPNGGGALKLVYSYQFDEATGIAESSNGNIGYHDLYTQLKNDIGSQSTNLYYVYSLRKTDPILGESQFLCSCEQFAVQSISDSLINIKYISTYHKVYKSDNAYYQANTFGAYLYQNITTSAYFHVHTYSNWHLSPGHYIASIYRM